MLFTSRSGILALIIVLCGCKSSHVYEATPYNYPQSYNTEDRTIQLQDKKVYHPQGTGVYASNQFDGARLNDFSGINDSTYRALILPENTPINPSPWYAFKLWGTSAKEIYVQLDYQKYKHRYRPKISHDGTSWQLLDSMKITLSHDSTAAILALSISPDTLWVAGQEVINSKAVYQWCSKIANHDDVSFSTIGTSKLGREIPFLDITSGTSKKKDVVVILSRQHPPEVTGYFAMQQFVESILEENLLSQTFRDHYRIMVFPLLNPDGVDLGHWRHSAAGVDLNRDWAYYHQPETRTVANFIVKETSIRKNRVLLGLDFHSTWWDVYYTLDHKTTPSILPDFTRQWLSLLEKKIEGYNVREEPSGLTRAVSKNWFNAQFNAEGITYEIGDQTPRHFIEEKGRVSAEIMMQLLLNSPQAHSNQ